MPFFLKLKKAKEAAAEHKKEAATQEEKKPKVPYKHIPVHAGIDALAATPSSMGSSELREKIAAARRSRSVSSASAPAYRSGASFYRPLQPSFGHPCCSPASGSASTKDCQQPLLRRKEEESAVSHVHY
ncbi:uncharacterized protein M421DRAFT_235661 [Didymella exigua CBS 183.55]|uniref:Uncharacterized protein n=1 Tax=Didymella exigua CBS 183.55 TaxID=1150837 RepID=A0A6A5RDZ6_9PLEO|nr:uncharacterized protein M421DRAFT_235661 [Didymella exigua CBS 183.55]KAF1925683.1 hypothetical protein M421DRAFT_235661 [Didymella exigua CBS 183.55]